MFLTSLIDNWHNIVYFGNTRPIMWRLRIRKILPWGQSQHMLKKQAPIHLGTIANAGTISGTGTLTSVLSGITNTCIITDTVTAKTGAFAMEFSHGLFA